MIKTRLLKLLSEGRKYILYQVIWQWIALLGQIVSVFAIGNLAERILEGTVKEPVVLRTLLILLCMTALRFLADQMAARMSYAASADVKNTLRDRIYEKLLRLGASYRERISSAEVVQMSVEGVEQLETYFGRYLPQLFYSILAPVTLFLCLKSISLRASVVLLICVPLIPASIIAVQKIAKKLLQRHGYHCLWRSGGRDDSCGTGIHCRKCIFWRDPDHYFAGGRIFYSPSAAGFFLSHCNERHGGQR